MKNKIQTLLREQAYQQVADELKELNINIANVSDEDIETLVAAKVQDMQSNLKGFSVGSVLATALTLLIVL